jgi:hypothetical protein
MGLADEPIIHAVAAEVTFYGEQASPVGRD